MTIYKKTFVKDPYAVKDYTVDWTDWLESDTIISSTWSIPSGIVRDSDEVFEGDQKSIIWLSGGTSERDYDCYNTIITAGGRTERAMIKIQVR